MDMLFKAIDQTKSDDPVKIAAALEGMKYPNFSANEEGFMRSDDHQFFEPLYISSFGPLGSTEPFDEEHTGWGWRLAAQIPVKDTIVPTTCKMNRPS
jgi:branched-chain amino acid transport system substrate-binding protein